MATELDVPVVADDDQQRAPFVRREHARHHVVRRRERALMRRGVDATRVRGLVDAERVHDCERGHVELAQTLQHRIERRAQRVLADVHLVAARAVHHRHPVETLAVERHVTSRGPDAIGERVEDGALPLPVAAHPTAVGRHARERRVVVGSRQRGKRELHRRGEPFTHRAGHGGEPARLVEAHSVDQDEDRGPDAGRRRRFRVRVLAKERQCERRSVERFVDRMCEPVRARRERRQEHCVHDARAPRGDAAVRELDDGTSRHGAT